MKKLETRDDLRAFVDGLLKAVEHHAANIKAQVHDLIVNITRYAEDWEARTWKNRLMANVWVTMNGQRYAFVGVRVAKNNYKVVVHRKNANGPVITEVTDQTSSEAIEVLFKVLKAD